ncbi:MAG: O-antigen ligase family protein [Planctomycetes bacterium]|nr:O-antigen ligase family protein [Planctomycetota bacterium]
MTKHIVFWGLCAVLVFVPLPIGSVEEWAVFVFEAATIGLFLVYLGGEIASRRKRLIPTEDDPLAPTPARLPLFFKILLAVFLAVSFLQVVPLPASIVKILSPRAYGITLGLVRDGLAAPSGWLTLSLAPSATLSEFVLILCYGIFGFLVLRTVRSRRQVEIFVLVIVASALFQALYGMAEMFSGHEMIFGRVKRFGAGSVTGTYVNRNHFAGFLEMAFPLSLGYLLVKARYFAMEKGLSIRQRILWFGQESLQWTLLLGLVPAFIGVGLVFSKSRSGIMVLVVTAVLAAAATASWREFSEEEGEGSGPGTKRRFGRIVRLVVMVVLAAAVWLGIGPVIDRFSEMDISYEARRLFYENTVEMIGDYPWVGTGKGTYVDAYAMYEEVDDSVKLSYAHNDYLEFAAENGVVAGGALAAAGIGLAVWLAAMWRRRRSSFAKGIGLGAMLGVTAILIHGFTDFNLQIPANAVYFTALAMLGVVVLSRAKNGDTPQFLRNWDMSPNQDEEGGHEQERGHVPAVHVPKEAGRGRVSAVRQHEGGHVPQVRVPGKAYRRLGWFGRMRHGPVGPPVAVLLALGLLVAAFHDFRGFQYLGQYRRARSEARSVESAFPTLEALLEKAVNASPRSEFRIELARLYTEMARVANDAARDEEREAFCDRAASAYERAIAANPVHAFTFYETGLVYLLSNYPLMTYADRARTYFRKAIELKPADDFLNLNVIFLYFNWWQTLEDAEKAYAAGLYRQAVARDPGLSAKLEARWKQSFQTTDRLAAILAEIQ